MKKVLYCSLAVTALLCGLAWAVHGSNPRPTFENGKLMKVSPTHIQLGNPHDSDLKGPGASIDNHPTGISFYQRDWMRGNLGAVEFVHGKHSFVIDNVLSVLGVADKDLPGGIYDWNISFGVSPEQADTHEAALARMMKLLSELRASGWTRYIGTGHPRLTGKQAWGYRKVNSAYSLDSSYNWKALLPVELKEYHADRLKAEAALEAQGDTIDTAYQDPPINALQGSPANP